MGRATLAAVKDGSSPRSKLGLLKKVTFLLAGVEWSRSRALGLCFELGTILS